MPIASTTAGARNGTQAGATVSDVVGLRNTPIRFTMTSDNISGDSVTLNVESLAITRPGLRIKSTDVVEEEGPIILRYTSGVLSGIGGFETTELQRNPFPQTGSDSTEINTFLPSQLKLNQDDINPGEAFGENIGKAVDMEVSVSVGSQSYLTNSSEASHEVSLSVSYIHT